MTKSYHVLKLFAIILVVILLGTCLVHIVHVSGLDDIGAANDRRKELQDEQLQNLANNRFDATQMFKNNLSEDNPLLISYLRTSILNPSTEKISLAAIPANKDWSQMDESPTVDAMLYGKKNGFFVECVASDGETYSNSLFFELERNWTGLLIEANEQMFEKLKLKHRKAFAYNGCLSPFKHTKMLQFKPQSFLGGLSSFNGSIPDKNTEKMENKNDDVPVKCVPFYSLMLAFNRKHVDYFSLDVEGAELNILRTIPFNKITIDVLSVEYIIWNGGKENKEKEEKKLANIKNFFKDIGGYSEGKVHRGDVYFERFK